MTLERTDPATDPSAGPVPVLDEHRRHRGHRRWRGWLRRLVVALVVALLGFGIWVVAFSSWLALRQVDVNGTHRVSTTTVERAADLPMGTPLARVDLEAAAARIEQIPAIATATVHRGWPHSVVISVTERQPVATVHERSRWWLMDRTGVLFTPSTRPTAGHPIVLMGPHPSSQTRGQVAAMLATFPGDLSAQTVRITAQTPDAITVWLTGHRQVRWGNAAQSVLKAEVLRSLLPLKATFYDVSVPTLPATRGGKNR